MRLPLCVNGPILVYKGLANGEIELNVHSTQPIGPGKTLADVTIKVSITKRLHKPPLWNINIPHAVHVLR